MNLSKELQEKINLLLKNSDKLRESLLQGDVEAIRKLGSISQKGMLPEDVIDAYESNSKESMEYLYKKAKNILELQKLYRSLCIEYYNNEKTKQNKR